MRSSFGFAILTPTGEALYDYSQDVYNYARRPGVVADIDDYDTNYAGIRCFDIRVHVSNITSFNRTTRREVSGIEIQDQSTVCEQFIQRYAIASIPE